MDEPPRVEQPATTCYRHRDRVTGLRCSRCGRPICGECAVPAAVGQLCPDDARDRTRVRRLGESDRPPVVTLTLLAVNTVMLVVEAVLSGGAAGLLEPSARALCRLGALNGPAIAEDGQYWRLLTVMVLHAGVIHWAFNSYALYLFGPMLESLLGRVRFLALYVGSGLAGAGASLAFSHTQLGVGASGAIFGLLGALVAFFYRRRDVGGRAPLQSLLIILAFNVFIGARAANIDNFAHGGGFLAGLAALALLDLAPGRRDRGAGALRYGALALPFVVGIVLTAVAIGNGPTGLSCAGV
ncbi:MAG TPA: rhomboid family intramembrane serine protease [Actinomycetes bacterium]|jgi:membrane associated rhomboid family serine protease|nr:rhomboid family intramembrane serine protease [Actinomycetes bacterium]